jgi:RNA polymerase sigma-70 factor (ECF subfamily)
VQRQTFDNGYLLRLAQSDPETERDFVGYFGELLAIKLRSRLRASDHIDDVIQETFLRVLRTVRENSIENAEALGAFVNTVCNNVLFELYRQQSRLAEAPEDRASDATPAERELLNAEERSSVHRVLAELPEKDRELLMAVFIEEKEKEAVCRSLGVDREYLRVLLHRAKKRFRADWIKQIATIGGRKTPLV